MYITHLNERVIKDSGCRMGQNFVPTLSSKRNKNYIGDTHIKTESMKNDVVVQLEKPKHAKEIQTL